MGMCHSLLLLLNITDEQVLSGAYSPFAAGHSQGRVFPTPSLFTMQYAAWMCSNLVRCNHATLLILICFTIPLICLLYVETDRYQVKEIYSRSLSWPHCSCNRRYVRDEASYFPFLHLMFILHTGRHYHSLCVHHSRSCVCGRKQQDGGIPAATRHNAETRRYVHSNPQ
jgi:hypothetical protein